MKRRSKNPEAYAIWTLEQLINFGLNDQKINIHDLEKYWLKITIDPDRRHYLHFLLHDRLGTD